MAKTFWVTVGLNKASVAGDSYRIDAQGILSVTKDNLPGTPDSRPLASYKVWDSIVEEPKD